MEGSARSDFRPQYRRRHWFVPGGARSGGFKIGGGSREGLGFRERSSATSIGEVRTRWTAINLNTDKRGASSYFTRAIETPPNLSFTPFASGTCVQCRLTVFSKMPKD